MQHHHLAGLEAIHAIMQEKECVASSDLVAHRRMSRHTAIRRLQFFVRLGILEAIGKGRARIHVWADERFKKMTFEELADEAEAREAKLKARGGSARRGGTRRPGAKPPAPSAAGTSPVWAKTVPPGKNVTAWHKTDSDNLHLELEAGPGLYEELDPALRLEVSKKDPRRLMGIASRPFTHLIRRHGFGPLAFGGGDVTVDRVLPFIVAGVALDLAEKGELGSPAGNRRLQALHEHVRALSAKIGSRRVVAQDQNHKAILLHHP